MLLVTLSLFMSGCEITQPSAFTVMSVREERTCEEAVPAAIMSASRWAKCPEEFFIDVLEVECTKYKGSNK